VSGARRSLGVALAVVAMAPPAHAQEFTYHPPGDLVPGSGDGRVDEKVYVPGMLFPIEGKAYANSQVYGNGGLYGPGGGQCDAVNYSYPWRDNYCEKRSWGMPLCPSGIGHQGQDIRAETCQKDVHWSVASVDGTITSVGSYSVYLTAEDGTRHDYLHMDSVQVSVGQKVTRGTKLGRVSNNFGGTATSVHLHFNLRQNVASLGMVYVPTYLSLVKSYEATQTPPAPRGAVELFDCERIGGHAFDPENPDDALTVEIEVDGLPPTQDHRVVANRHREDLCDVLGSCKHAFLAPTPRSLFDGKPHELRFRLIDPTDGKRYELLDSPVSLTCGPVAPTAVRRPIDLASRKAWGFSAFWSELPADASSLPVGSPAPKEPLAWLDPSEPARLWVRDGDVRRELPTSRALDWNLDVEGLEAADDAVLELPAGRPLPERAELVVVDDQRFLLDSTESAPPSPPPTPTDPLGTSADSSCALASVGSSRSLTSSLGLLASIVALGLARSRKRAAAR